MDQHLHGTAITFGSQLTQLPGARVSDCVLFAKCFLLSGEYRRCLATLEHRGLLSADNILLVSRCLSVSVSGAGAEEGLAADSVDDIRDMLSAVQLAAKCLLSLKEYQDCLTLLSPLTSEVENMFRDETQMQLFYRHASSFSSASETEINPVAVLFNVVGQCMDMLENRPKAQMMLIVALRVDAVCTEAMDYLILNGLIGQREKISLVESALETCAHRKLDWLESFYRDLVIHGEQPAQAAAERAGQPNATSLAHRADYMYSRCRPEEAYRLAREAYLIDPFDWSGGILVYIVSMVELGLRTELFYLGHELAQSHPGQAVTWYCIGCYYWCCKKLTMAQAFLQKATKLDKR
jgi:anaphase-promoting complex subunit 6